MDLSQSAASQFVKDGSIETFTDDVLVASRDVPVIVDFWATWCQPCKTLGPMLEKAVDAQQGKLRMVKIDIDKNQMIAQQLRIQSVPTVMAFIAGQPVDGFAGALPESEINAFIDRVLGIAAQAGLGGGNAGPDAEEILSAAEAALAAGDASSAIQAFAQVAQATEENNSTKAQALAGIAKCHLATGNAAEAQNVIDQMAEELKTDTAVSAVVAMLELAQGSGNSDLSAASAKLQEDPENPDSQFAYAEALLSAGQMSQAADTLLQMIARDRQWNEEAARKKLLTVFEALGPTHDVTKDARRRLSSILFS